MTSARNGEQLACAELCRRHRETVLRVVLRITRNLDDAEDVLQDSWMRAFTHIGTFDGRSAFSTWVTRIAINSALGMIRKSGKHKEVSLDDPADPHRPGLTEMIELSRDPEERCLEAEILKLVRQAIRRLPSKLRSAIEIRQSQDGPDGTHNRITSQLVARNLAFCKGFRKPIYQDSRIWELNVVAATKLHAT